MASRVAWVCLVVAMAGSGTEASAQEQSPPSIPTELAVALLGGSQFGAGERPRIVVGRAPDGMLPSVTSLESGTVLGGLSSERSVVVVFAFTLPPNQVLVSVDRQLRARGLSAPPPPPDANRGGFVSSDYGSPFGTTYCTDSTGVTLASMPAPKGGTYLKLTQLRNQQFNFCVPRERSRFFSGTDLKFPPLRPPPGMTAHGGGSGMGGNSASISARLSGPLKPADLVAHYRAQLDAAGWRTRAPVTTGEDAALAYVEATDSTGVIWRGVMTSVQSGPSEVVVEIDMFKSSGR